MLQHYIKSFRRGLWDNKCLPAKWIAWRIILGQLRHDQGYTFIALNAQEYIDSIRDKLPYLDDSDLQFLYDKINENKTYYVYDFAGPSLIVDNSYRMLRTGKTWEHIEGKWESVDNKYFLKYSGRVQRLPSSYADQQLHGDGIYYDLFFSEKAMSYAREHWSSILQVQPILEKVETKFADPAKHRPSGGAQMIFRLYYLMNSMHDIDIITHDQIIFDEIGLDPYSSFGSMCVYDGSALGRHKCNVCERTFPEETCSLYLNGGSPISEKMMSYLEENKRHIGEYNGLSNLTQFVPDRNLWDQAREKKS